MVAILRAERSWTVAAVHEVRMAGRTSRPTTQLPYISRSVGNTEKLFGRTSRAVRRLPYPPTVGGALRQAAAII